MKIDKKIRFGSAKMRDVSENVSFGFLLLPFMILFFVFTILPILSSAVLSFFDFDMFSKPIFTGLSNYLRMFTGDKLFPTVLKNTLVMAIITGPVSFILSFFLAWAISEFKPLTRTLLAFLFYAPALVGNAYYIWQVAFSGDSIPTYISMVTNISTI